MLLPDLSAGESGRKLLEKLGISEEINVLWSYREYYFPDFRIRRPADFLGKDWRKKYLQRLFPEDAQGPTQSN